MGACRLLAEVASLIVEHGLWGVGTSVVVAYMLSSCGSQVQELRLSSCGPQAELSRDVESSWTRGQPMSPALAGRFLSTVPLGKSFAIVLISH